MVISYDKNPSLNTDQKLQSLIESMQLALNEIENELNDIKKKLKELEDGSTENT